PLPQIVELRPPDVTGLHDLDALDPRRVDRERPLDPDAVRNAAQGEGGAQAFPALPDHHALEDLHALLLALDDLDVHAHGVAGREGVAVLLQYAGLDGRDGIHDVAPLSQITRGRRAPGQASRPGARPAIVP